MSVVAVVRCNGKWLKLEVVVWAKIWNYNGERK